jgi:sec-independent protein translocase protein TatC
MTFADHLSELRKRLIVSAVAVVVGTAASFLFADSTLNVLLLPSGGLQLRAFKLLDGFMIKFRLALYSGIIFSAPVWAYEAIRFITPGLRQKERSLLAPFVVSSLILFGAGTAFGYYLLWGMIRVLVRLFPPRIEYFPSADDYVSFVTFFLLSCGIAFQLPCVLIALVRLRIVNTVLLRKGRRIAYFALFAFAEIITPVSDPIVAPLTVMLPLVVLYEAAVLIARKLETSRQGADSRAPS